MATQSLTDLNAFFGRGEAVKFVVGVNGLTIAKLSLVPSNAHASIYLHGAHVTSFVNEVGKELLFMSSKTNISATANIRGGIPVIFPQFGPTALPNTKALPQHGFARSSNDWRVIETTSSDNEVSITMELRDSESTRKVWPHAFSLQLKTAITVDPITKAQLVQELRVKNLNPVDGFYFTNALHSYFAISDITSTGLLGLKSNSYIDRASGGVNKQEDRKVVSIERETDSLYVNSSNEVFISENGKPSILLKKRGFGDLVVWNVWGDKAKSMADLGEGEWRKYICAEAAQTVPVLLAPNKEWLGSQVIRAAAPLEAKL